MADEDHAQRELDEATRFVLSHPQGRRFAWWVLEQCHLFGSSMTGNSYSFHMEGERNIGLKVVARLSAVNATAFPELMLEMKADEEARRAAGKDKDSHVSEADE